MPESTRTGPGSHFLALFRESVSGFPSLFDIGYKTASTSNNKLTNDSQC